MPVSPRMRWNEKLGMVVKIVNNKAYRLEPDAIVPAVRNDKWRVNPKGSNEGARWKRLHSGDIRDTDWQGHPEHTPLKQRRSYVEQLADIFAPRKGKGITDEMKADHFKMRRSLNLLSPFELSEMVRQWDVGPLSEKAEYQRRYEDHIDEKVRNHEFRYPHSAIPDFVPGQPRPRQSVKGGKVSKVTDEMKEHHYLEETKNALTPMRIGKIAPLYMDNQLVLDDFVEVYHPDMGNILLRRVKGAWEAFDGFGVSNATSQITVDAVRSNLMLKHGLLAPVQAAIDHLDSLPESEIRSMRKDGDHHYNGEQRGDTYLDAVELFNDERTLTPHVPTVNYVTPAHKKALDTHLGKIATLAKSGVSSSTINATKKFASDSLGAYCMLNNLHAINPTEIVNKYRDLDETDFMALGHQDLHSENSEELFNILKNQNPRMESVEGEDFYLDRDKAHSVTGYAEVLDPSGNVVEERALTAAERKKNREHYSDLYDRPTAFLHNTQEGRDIYDFHRKGVADELSEMEKGDKNELIWTYARFRNIGGAPASKLINEEGRFKSGEFEGAKVSDVYNNFGDARLLLSEEQQDFMDQVEKSDIAKHILGIPVDGDQLLRDRTLDELLGYKWYPDADDWKHYEEHTEFPSGRSINDAFNLRVGGVLELTAPDEEGDYGLIYYEDAGGGVLEHELYPPNQISDKNSQDYAGNLYKLFRPSVLDQFVRDGVLPATDANGNLAYASSKEVQKRPGAPTPPNFSSSSEDLLARVSFIYSLVNSYPQNEKISGLHRGFDNSPPSFEYDINPDNPDAIRVRDTFSEGNDPLVRQANGNMLKILYSALNDKEMGEPFYYGDKALIPGDVNNMNPSEPAVVNGRLITVVTMPDDSRQPFYRRTGGGNVGHKSDTEPGVWMPFYGITAQGHMIKPQEFEKGYEAESKMARYGNAANHAMSQRLGVAFEEKMLFVDEFSQNSWGLEPNDKGGDNAVVSPKLSAAQRRVLYGDDSIYNPEIQGVAELEGKDLYESLNKHLANEGYAEASNLLDRDFGVKDHPVGTPSTPAPPTGGTVTGATAGDPDEPEYRFGNLDAAEVAASLEADPAIRAYRDELRNKEASEILQNAPLQVRATAWRQRLAGIEERMKHLETQGDAHNLTRELMRAAIVEHPDMMSIDRDGASIFRRLSRQMVQGGADLFAIDKELQDHRNTVNDFEHFSKSIKEYQQSLIASGLVLDPSKVPVEDWDEKQKEAYDRYATLQDEIISLHDQKIRYTYGSKDHLENLRNPKFGLAEVYDNMDNTKLSADAQQKLNNYSRLKDGKNVVASALQVGVDSFRESRLLGNSHLASMLQAVTSTIGEGTGFGGDKIRGLDVTKPMDQHWSEAGGWASWLKLPIPDSIGGFAVGSRSWIPDGIRQEKAEAWRRKQAGRQGEVYTPEPTAQDPEYAEPLERTGGKITVEAPVYEPEEEEVAQNVSPPEDVTPEDTESPVPTPSPVQVTENKEQKKKKIPAPTPEPVDYDKNPDGSYILEDVTDQYKQTGNL